MFGIIWLVVGAFIALYGLFQYGRTGDADYILSPAIGALWPFVFLAAIIASPFVGAYHLGKFLRK